MNSRIAFAVSCSAAALSLCLGPVARASSEWVDIKGNKIEAEPVEALGPLAIFDNGGIVPFNMLAPEDCVRFYQSTKSHPERATDWSAGTSKVTEEFIGRVFKYDGDKLVADDLKGRPEPELYMVFYATNGESRSWDMIGKVTPDLFDKLQKAYPGMVQGLLFGVQEAPSEHAGMAISMKGGWLVTDFRKQVEMDTLRRMTPTVHFGIVVMTRQGVPLFGPDALNENDIRLTFAKTATILDQIRPGNHHMWAARKYYLDAVQPVAYASGKSDPVLVGNPLVADGLRQRKIYQVDATIHVTALGTVSAVDLKPEGIPAGMAAPLADALKKSCVFVAAVDHGKFVDGTYMFHMDVPH